MLWVAVGVALAGLLVTPEQLPQEAPADEAFQPPVFGASFLTTDFLAQVGAQEEARRIADERMTKVFLDERSGLLWTTRDNGRDVDWRRALSYCEDLELAGYSDWRLPTLEELEGLYKPWAAGQYKVPGEISLTACCPWSSTKKSEDSAWNFNFQYREAFSGGLSYTYDLRALCVRRPAVGEESLAPVDSD